MFENLLALEQGRPLALADCGIAARFGAADLAFDRLFAALDSGRAITGSTLNAVHLTRAATLNFVFGSPESKAFIADKRFAKFCARIGLVDYWRTSGHWPDCADEVSYDFKSECEKAAREVEKQ
jgi:hypothetical protein